MRHFVDISAIDPEDLSAILKTALALKSGKVKTKLPGKQLAMVFEKPSTRTRVSFEVGINQLGGQGIMLLTEGMQLGRGEPVSDTAKVLSRYVDMIMLRCFEHKTIEEMATHATVPVINGLTNYSHPCQVMADIMTIEEHIGSIAGKTIAWVGDGNNMTNSWIHAAVQFGFNLRIATPRGYSPTEDKQAWAKSSLHPGQTIEFLESPEAVVRGADVVTTDTWVSMGDEDAAARKAALAPYQVNDALMAKAASGAIFLHCLPAHRGEEVVQSVIDGPQSVIFDEAENRLHVQKAIMLWCNEAL